jgi:hypothetical protein
MNVLVVSEGKHELGNEFRDERSAALITLVTRAAARELECTAMRVTDPAFRSHGAGDRGPGGRLFKRAVRCLRYAMDHGFEALIFFIDQDDDPDRRQFLDRAQDYSAVAIGRAFGLAVRTFDAWMIADEQALSRVLGRTVQRQPDPEDIRDPKNHCNGLRGDNAMSLTDLYERVALEAALATIEERCPKGFASFAARLRQL